MDDSVATRKALGEVTKNVKNVYRRLSYVLPMLSAIKAYYDANGEINDELAQHVSEELYSTMRLLNDTVDILKGEDIPF